MPPRPDVSEERRTQIIESAVRVFARRGLADARMDDVAAESGVSKGLLYWYFQSKDELIVAIADLLFGGALRKWENRSGGGASAEGRLTAFLEAFIADTRMLLKVTPVVYEFYSLAFRNPAVRKAMKKYLSAFIKIVQEIVQSGIDSGEFVSGNPRQLALAIGAMLEGTLLLWAYDPDSVPAEKQWRLGMDLIVKGLKSRA